MSTFVLEQLHMATSSCSESRHVLYMPLLMADTGFVVLAHRCSLLVSPICFLAEGHIANLNARSAQSRVNAASRHEEVQSGQSL